MALDVHIRSTSLDQRCCFLETEDLLVDMREQLTVLTDETGQRLDLYGDAVFKGAELARLEFYLEGFLAGIKTSKNKLRPNTRKDAEALMRCVRWAVNASAELAFVGD